MKTLYLIHNYYLSLNKWEVKVMAKNITNFAISVFYKMCNYKPVTNVRITATDYILHIKYSQNIWVNGFTLSYRTFVCKLLIYT